MADKNQPPEIAGIKAITHAPDMYAWKPKILAALKAAGKVELAAKIEENQSVLGHFQMKQQIIDALGL